VQQPLREIWEAVFICGDNKMIRRIDRVLYGTKDPKTTLNVKGTTSAVPALTTLLITVCDSNPDKFDEATRLLELFIEKAFEVGEIHKT
jgi:hypothetical protein